MTNALRSIPYRGWLLIITVAVVIALGINPTNRADYLLEHSPTAKSAAFSLRVEYGSTVLAPDSASR